MVIALGERERATIVRLYVAGLSVADLSEIAGPSTTWIRGLLHAQGVVRSRRESAELWWRRRQVEDSVMTAWRCNQLSVGQLITLLDDCTEGGATGT